MVVIETLFHDIHYIFNYKIVDFLYLPCVFISSFIEITLKYLYFISYFFNFFYQKVINITTNTIIQVKCLINIIMRINKVKDIEAKDITRKDNEGETKENKKIIQK
ncbi:hypothetical protein EDI_203050 [Entamoeba dispar SAW760]|uniref:Uncharacterized protein n=1 Tax=Entamoeba dispar (strain ATCC PRA-260 / SAW760) TaxID=370354 RepID=B0EFT4_ENTDS|nr:uncharacterized protein EDI_203050 [Entamoeba dispar SAW760]EDR26611.1 hypothetical protein EDI_203050 [Entamoeba dispar SAW760]|eukprot:EDR26611.1 hypothetical protein EDI_203050 [Entamoeba dispar SAW760]